MTRSIVSGLLVSALALVGCAGETPSDEDEGDVLAQASVDPSIMTHDANTSGGNGFRWDFAGVTAYVSALPGAYELIFVNHSGTRLYINYETTLTLLCTNGNTSKQVQVWLPGSVADGATWRSRLDCLDGYPRTEHVWVHTETSFRPGGQR